jgi:hypothetical protein
VAAQPQAEVDPGVALVRGEVLGAQGLALQARPEADLVDLPVARLLLEEPLEGAAERIPSSRRVDGLDAPAPYIHEGRLIAHGGQGGIRRHRRLQGHVA